jgi:uncharacterized membrane protein YhaH (DUF805 family)
MKITFADLWRPSGTIDRGPYALVGILGFAIKHNLDRFVAGGFHRSWGAFNYWVPVRDVPRVIALRGNDAVFLETMVAISLPFIWIGVALTLKRLRSAQWPSSFILLFFVPFLNLLFLLVLCLVPAHNLPERNDEPRSTRPSAISRILPKNALGSAAVSALITVPIGLALALLGAQILVTHGWGLFVALPFAMGFSAALIYGAHQPRSFVGCVGVASLSVALLGLALLALVFEGLVCLAMAMPLALPLAIFGGSIGYLVQRRRWSHGVTPAFLSLIFSFVPGVQWVEHVVASPSPTFVVRSAMDIQAPPEKVWKQVVAFTEIPPPTELLFRAGIAYPIRAEMIGSGPSAERHCVFSTGAFVEPIEVWDEPHRLKFSVTSNPAPMEEWTPYSHVEPPHLHGFLVSEGGQFLLTSLPDGGTRLEGRTWYRHGLWPAGYWRLWSDVIIHRIHMRVLRHIREKVEAN